MWESFRILDTHTTTGQVVELLNQIESQGYEPKFLYIGSQGAEVFAREKEPKLLEAAKENNESSVLS